jgi:hypothetical protein
MLSFLCPGRDCSSTLRERSLLDNEMALETLGSLCEFGEEVIVYLPLPFSYPSWDCFLILGFFFRTMSQPGVCSDLELLFKKIVPAGIIF